MTKGVAIGFRVHSGWGVLVAVSNDGALEIADRRHIAIAEAGISGSKQPYHYAENLGLKQAEEHISRCFAASQQLALSAIREVVSHMEKNACTIKGSAILMSSGRPLPSLEKILSSHALIHTAEGEFFRMVVRKACEDTGIPVTSFRERDLEERANQTFRRKANQVKQHISTLGKRIGPPWTQDEKLAALAAALILTV
jgi:hypothetical protein